MKNLMSNIVLVAIFLLILCVLFTLGFFRNVATNSCLGFVACFIGFFSSVIQATKMERFTIVASMSLLPCIGAYVGSIGIENNNLYTETFQIIGVTVVSFALGIFFDNFGESILTESDLEKTKNQQNRKVN